MFSQSYFSLPDNHITLECYFSWNILSFHLFAYFGRIYNKKYIQDENGKQFGSIETAYSMGVNDYYGPRRTDRPHETPNCGAGNSKFEVDYCMQTYFSQEELSHIRTKLEKGMSGSNVVFYRFQL